MDDVPGFRLRGTLWNGPGRRLHRAEALGSPGRPLLLEVHDLEPEDRMLERMRRQTEVIAALEHPGLLPVRAIIRARGGMALVMPAVSGGSLEEVLDRAGDANLTAGAVDAISTALRDAVDAAHANGVHHGALSAAQVHFDGGGQPVILGFGAGALRGAEASGEDRFEVDRRDLEGLLERCRSRTATATDVSGDRVVGGPGGAASRERPSADDERALPSADGPVRYRLVLAAAAVLATPALLVGVSLAFG